VVTINAEDLCGWLTRAAPHRRLTALLIWLITIGVGCGAVWKQIREHRNLPDEDFAGAVQYLRQRVMPADILLVHPSVIEGFKLYTRMEGWHDHHAIYGDTGWPCCLRDKIAPPGASTERAVADDLDRKIPRGFSGRVWMLYSGRHSHWVWAGLDEGVVWRAHMTEEGCPPGPYRVLANLPVSAMECVNKR
jgi:hypothetical protein